MCMQRKVIPLNFMSVCEHFGGVKFNENLCQFHDYGSKFSFASFISYPQSSNESAFMWVVEEYSHNGVEIESLFKITSCTDKACPMCSLLFELLPD